MKRFLWLSFFLLYTGRIAAGQRGMLKPGKPKAQGSSSESGVVVEAGPTGCLVEKNGTFLLKGQDFRYYLKGHEEELAGHDGDEVRVTGTMILPQKTAKTRFAHPLTIKVKTVEILHDNNPAGQAPALGPVSGWKTILSPLYGLRFRVPKTFPDTNHPYLPSAANFVSSEGVEMLGSFNIPNATFANTNFRDGSSAVFVSRNIHSESACGVFADFEPKLTSSATVHGIRFANTERDGAAAGTSSSTYYFHTYQDGFCFEFVFNFFELDGTGWDYPICAVQWINRHNRRQLTDALLSAVQFFKPSLQPARAAKPVPVGPPNVTSFTQTPVPNKNVRIVRFAWSTEGADFVRIHLPHIRNIAVLGHGFYFYNQNTHNFPPTGHAEFIVGNSTEAPVKVPFSIEPFHEGVAYPKQSKTLTLTLNPRH